MVTVNLSQKALVQRIQLWRRRRGMGFEEALEQGGVSPARVGGGLGREHGGGNGQGQSSERGQHQGACGGGVGGLKQFNKIFNLANNVSEKFLY